MGCYDAQARLFVGTSEDGVVTTVITKATQKYVDNVKKGRLVPEIVIDHSVDAAYLYVGLRVERRAVDRTEPLLEADGGMINLDFDEDGHLVGVELIPASAFLRASDMTSAGEQCG